MVDLHEFNISTDIYDTDKKGKEFLLKGGVSSKMSLNLRDILTIAQAFKNDGSLFKTKCVVYHVEMGKIMLNHSYNKVKEIKDNFTKSNSRVKIKGFR